MNFLLTMFSVLAAGSCVVRGASLWDLMPGTNPHSQKTKVNHNLQGVALTKSANRGSQGGFWGQILQHSKEGQTPSEKYSSKNSQPLVTIASESVMPSAGLQKQRKNIPESLRSLHTLYTDYDDFDEDYYDGDYHEGNYDSEYELVNIKNSDGEIQTVEDSHVDQVLRTHQ